MRVTEALQWARMVGLPMLEAEIFLEFLLRKSREFFIAHPEYKISSAEVSRFQKYCQARASGVPLAYLTHHKEFYGLDFYVDERVLIPRSETELLVEEAIKKMSNVKCQMSNVIFDIGTGSGCIAISLAKNLPRARIVAVDISKDALAVARKNAEAHGVSAQIEFIESNLLERIMVSLSNHDRQSLGIIANLPYIGTTEHHLIAKEVLEHEPHSALFSGKNGLELYERLFAQIRDLPKPPKWLIGEMGFLQQKAIEKFIRKYFGTISVNFKHDLSGLPRLFSIYF